MAHSDHPKDFNNIQRTINWLVLRIIIFSFTFLLIGAAALSFVSTKVFDRDLDKNLTANATMLSWALASDLEHGLKLGFPLEKLGKVREFLAKTQTNHPEVIYVGLFNTQGFPIHDVGEISKPDLSRTAESIRNADKERLKSINQIESDRLNIVLKEINLNGTRQGYIVVGVDQKYAEQKLRDMALDIITVMMVSLLISFEILTSALGRQFTTPLRNFLALLERGRNGQIDTSLDFNSSSILGELVKQYNQIIHSIYQKISTTSSNSARNGIDFSSMFNHLRDKFGLDFDSGFKKKSISSLIDVRLPLFIFVFAEELQKSFLPLYTSSLAEGVSWITPSILVGLPIAVYMFILAVATPLAGKYSDIHGFRRIFLLGLIPAIAGYLGAAFAQDVITLLIARGTTAFGYAAVTIAAQGYIAYTSSDSEKAAGMSSFITTIMAAAICGLAVGGIVASEVGYRAVFIMSAVFALSAGLVGFFMISKPQLQESGRTKTHSGDKLNSEKESQTTSTLTIFCRMLANPRFLALALLIAIPGKIALTGFLFYSVPIYSFDLGLNESDIGRIMIIYAMLVIFIGPVLSRLADKTGQIMLCTTVGTFFTGVSIAVLYAWSGSVAVITAVILLGLSHAASISPQTVLTMDICRKEVTELGQTTVLGILRMIERVGSVIGPLLVGALIALWGFDTTMLFIGIAISFSAVIFFLIFALEKSKRKNVQREKVSS